MISFDYLNHKGLKERRTITGPFDLSFQFHPGLGYQPGWFLSGQCVDRKARRSFALTRIDFTSFDDDNKIIGNAQFTLTRWSE